jgi:hypothetical protein
VVVLRKGRARLGLRLDEVFPSGKGNHLQLVHTTWSSHEQRTASGRKQQVHPSFCTDRGFSQGNGNDVDKASRTSSRQVTFSSLKWDPTHPSSRL